MYVHDPIDQEAERIAPYPKFEPIHAGFTGFAITLVSLDVFSIIAGIELQGRAWLAACVMSACGFAAPYIYFNNQKRRHFVEWGRQWKKAKGRDV